LVKQVSSVPVYLFQRFITAFLTLFGMSVVIFVLLRLVPGNIVDILFSSAGFVNPAAKQEIAHELGLDQPIPIQYGRWLRDIARGDLGKSYRYDIPAWQVIKPRIPVTVELAFFALLVAVLLGVPIGVLSAVRQDTATDYLLRTLSLAGLSMPSFWLGMVIILFLVSWFGWIPSMTYVSPFEDFKAHVLQFLFPALAVGYRSSALIMRITRSSMLDVLREDYIRTAWAKGQREWIVVFGHALRNAMLPIVTVIGIEFAFMIGGLVVTETVFNLPGVARYLVDAILWRDYPVVQNLVMFIAIVVVVANLSVDLLYGWLDPRIRYRVR
jgi:peptide/nickel transport system permease protein